MIVWSLVLACACSDRPAQADGAAPFPDGRAADPADDLGTVAEIIEADAAETSAPPVPILPGAEIIEADAAETSTPPVPTLPGGDEVPGRIVYSIPPNGGPTFAEKWTAEILALLALIWVFFQSRVDVGRILRQLAIAIEETAPAELAGPVDRSEVERLQAETIAGLRQEIIDREQRIALMEEANRRAGEAEKQSALQRRPLERLGDRELTERLEARGRSALS